MLYPDKLEKEMMTLFSYDKTRFLKGYSIEDLLAPKYRPVGRLILSNFYDVYTLYNNYRDNLKELE